MKNKLFKSLFISVTLTLYALKNIVNAGVIRLNNNTDICVFALTESFSSFYSYGSPNGTSANTGFEEEGSVVMFVAEYSGELAFLPY